MQILTNSRIQTWRRCPRKHKLAYELGIRRRTDAQALRMGSAVHLGIEMLAKGHRRDDAIELAIQGYDTLPEGYDLGDWGCERAKVICMVGRYHERWQDDGFEFLYSERSFQVPIINPKTNYASRLYRFAGVMDGIIAYDGRTCLLETKTTSDDITPGSDYWLRLRIDPQLSGYFLAGRQLGTHFDEIVYNVIKKPGLIRSQVPLRDENGFKIVLDANGERVYLANGKPRQSGDTAKGFKLETRLETPDEYLERVWAEMSNWEKYFARQRIGRTESDIAHFQRDLWNVAHSIREDERTGYAPCNTNSCLHPRCPYTSLCFFDWSSDDQLPESFEVVSNVHPELGGEETHATQDAATVQPAAAIADDANGAECCEAQDTLFQ